MRSQSFSSKSRNSISAFLTITILAMLAALLFAPLAQAQTTGTLTGTAYDQTGAVVPKSKVILLNQTSGDIRQTTCNEVGYFSFVGVVPGVYTVTVEAEGFKSWKRAEIVINPGDLRTISNVKLEIGKSTESITVEATPDEVKPVDSGERASVLTTKDIDKLVLATRDVTVLMKILPGVSTDPGLGAGSGVDWRNIIGAQGSLVGNGLEANGAPRRGGTGITNDGVDIIDPGCNCWGIQTVLGDMTQEVKVQTSNFGADNSKGPVVVNSIGRSGGASYHGEAYLHMRTAGLNANSWQNNHQTPDKTPRGDDHYYYPGGSFGGPVPGTKKRLQFWFGYQKFIQHLGGTNSLESAVPSLDMIAGNFDPTSTNNAPLCSVLTSVSGTYCAQVAGNSRAPDGSLIATNDLSGFIDPGAQAMIAAVFPTPNRTPDAGDPNNFRLVIPSTHNGYIYRTRVDYSFSDNTKFYVSYQYGTDFQLAQGNGAHMWWTPGNSVPFPGGGLTSPSYSKSLTGHFLHVFSPSLTNEFIAAWGWGSSPTQGNVSAAYRDNPNVNYPGNYGTIYKLGAKMIPSFNSPGGQTFPDFSQADVFEATGSFPTKKEMPSFADNITKVWRNHTVKLGAFYESTSNFQGEWLSPNGIFSYGTGINPDANHPTHLIGSQNPFAAFLMGEATGYSENNTFGVTDMAFHTISGYVQDDWKASRRLTVNLGFRLDHVGRWYDRQGNGMAVWLPGRIESDMRAGKMFPGVYSHGIDPGIPNSGSPSRGAFFSPRFGLAYDVFGTGKTVLRGGWGAYRWNDQYNDYAGALTTAQGTQTFNLPSNQNVLLSDIGLLPVPAATWSPSDVTVADPKDYEVPVTYSYNFTISQALPWKSLFEIAYVGSNSEKLLMGGQSGASDCGSGCNFINQNKVPLGAFFGPDKICGSDISNASSPCFNAFSSDPNYAAEGASAQDYTPYGWIQESSKGSIPGIEQCNPDNGNCYVKVYGSNQVKMAKHVGYSSYNALQMSWIKQAGRLSYNLNYTWSKTLGTSLHVDAFSVHGNYGVVGVDRPHVINMSYAYSVPDLTHGNKFLGGVTNGWTISGLYTWQAGGNLQALYSPNFNMDIVNCTPQDDGSCVTVGPSNITSASFFGTNAQTVLPDLTCNPGTGLGSNQRARVGCFAVPGLALGGINANGPRQTPYLHGPIFWNSDLGIYKTFHITERQNVQFRISAFNFLNHPLRSFSGTDNQLKLHFQGDLANLAAGINSTVTGTNWGYLNSKDGQRTMELEFKYTF